jgi:hypothetical protein
MKTAQCGREMPSASTGITPRSDLVEMRCVATIFLFELDWIVLQSGEAFCRKTLLESPLH